MSRPGCPQGGNVPEQQDGSVIGTAARNRVLLVSDDALLRRMAARTLHHAGCEVIEAGGGEQGLMQYARQAADLVMLDLESPGVSAYEVCARLRSTASGAQVPIMILAGHDDAESIAQARCHGATDFVRKPIDWQALAARVHAALRLSGPGPALAGRVLLATASAQYGALMAVALRDAGATVSVVDNSQAAVESALQNDFDLVLLDMGLTHIDGKNAARILRACGHRRPIVALTGGPLEPCADCEAVLPLAVGGPQLRQLVGHLLAVGAASAAAPLEAAYWDELADQRATFRKGLPAQLHAMSGALQTGQWTVLLSLAHGLKGTAGLFGLGRLTESAGALEADLRTARTDRIAALYDALFSAMESALVHAPRTER